MDQVRVTTRQLTETDYEGSCPRYPSIVVYGKTVTEVVLEMETQVRRYRESRADLRPFEIIV